MRAVFTKQNSDLIAVGRANRAGFAEVDVAAAPDFIGETPCHPSILGKRGEEPELDRIGAFSIFLKESAVVVKHGHVVTFLLEGGHIAHHHDAAPVADGFEFAPRFSVVLSHGHTRGVETGKHDDAFLAGGVDDAVQGGDFLGCRPTCGSRQPLAPGFPSVRAAFVYDAAPAVTFGVNA